MKIIGEQKFTISKLEAIHKVKTALEDITGLLKKNQKLLYNYFLSAHTTPNRVCRNLENVNFQIRKAIFFLKKENRTSQQPILDGLFSFLYSFLTQKPIESITDSKKKALRFLEIQAKMITVPNFLEKALVMEDDITTKKMEEYPHIQERTVLISNDQVKKRKIQKGYKDLKEMMAITTAAVITEHRVESLLLQKIVFGLSFPRFFFDQDECLLRCYSLWRNPNPDMLCNVWNLPQKGAIKHCKGITYCSIPTSLQLHIPTKCKQKDKPSYNIFQENQQDQTVKVLVLHHEKLSYKDQKRSFCSCFPCFESQPEEIDTIIVYVHGGGFLALSSTTMQTYTRRWAKQLRVPIFCIDYRKPPAFQFPTAINDCLAVYEFITNYIHNYFNIRPRNIVLAGDSAGGNLVCSLEGLILKNNLLKPKGIFLAYPAVDLRKKYTPSRLHSFNDAILLPTLLLLCQKSYLGQDQANEHNPLASPIFLTQSFIQNDEQVKDKRWPQSWPRTVIMVGKKDPLFDDSLRLMEVMVNGGVDVKLNMYEDFSHAFLSLDMVVSECEEPILTSIAQLRHLMG